MFVEIAVLLAHKCTANDARTLVVSLMTHTHISSIFLLH